MFLIGLATGLAVGTLPSGSLVRVVDFFGEVMAEYAKQRQQAQRIQCSECGYDGTSPEEHQAQHRAHAQEAAQSLEPGPVPIRNDVAP